MTAGRLCCVRTSALSNLLQANAEGTIPSQLSNHACHQTRHGGQTVWPHVQHIRSRRYSATNQERFQTGIGVKTDCDLLLGQITLQQPKEQKCREETVRQFLISPFLSLPLQQLFAHRIEQIEHQKAEVQKAITDLKTLLASRMQYWVE
jgi:hypothetical protein